MSIPFSWTHPCIARRHTRHGAGLFTLKPINGGERVIAFGGYMIPTEVFTTLPPQVREHPFQVADDLFFGQISAGELCDADYLNHSCEPNCGFSGQAFVVAMCDIAVGKEVAVDYAMCGSSPALRSFACLCGAASCRREIRYDDWKLANLQKKYAGYFQEYLEEKIRLLQRKARH